MRQLVQAGMNVARLNFSHGTHEDHLNSIRKIERIRKETGKNVGILQDLCGPKIRTGDLPEEGIELSSGSEVHLKPGGRFDSDSDPPLVPVSYLNLLDDIAEGRRILLDDGLLELRVEKRSPDRLECRVVNGGLLMAHKGVNFPKCTLSSRAPTSRDIEDLTFGLKNGVDFVALSFVQSREDMDTLREEIRRESGNVSVIAKLERETALDNLDSILSASDGVMVARGDLGIEAELTEIPIHQKKITHEANRRGITVIIATQMLDSMIRNPLPTRAEVTDVANAIHDGADAIMLSGETAIGKYPVEAVRIMRRIADNIEEDIGVHRGWVREERQQRYQSIDMAVARSACTSAEKLDASLIVAHTLSGQTARRISQNRPSTPIVAITPIESTFHQLSLVWGVEGILMPGFEESFINTVRRGDQLLVERGFAEQGDLVIISAGIPAGKSGGTNVMKVHRVGESR
jgi:pyruvate kinase